MGNCISETDAPKGQKTDGEVDKMAQRATSKATA